MAARLPRGRAVRPERLRLAEECRARQGAAEPPLLKETPQVSGEAAGKTGTQRIGRLRTPISGPPSC